MLLLLLLIYKNLYSYIYNSTIASSPPLINILHLCIIYLSFPGNIHSLIYHHPLHTTGPCPPCPQTVTHARCFCQKETSLRRCANRFYSCQRPCARLLNCGTHKCEKLCHPDACDTCQKVNTLRFKVHLKIDIFHELFNLFCFFKCLYRQARKNADVEGKLHCDRAAKLNGAARKCARSNTPVASTAARR